jgi:hypothetical protein
MIKMNEEIYLQNLTYERTGDNKGCVIGEIVFKNAMTYEEFEDILDKRYLVLTDKSQNNWNELKKWLEEESKLKGSETAYLYYGKVLKQMQELEGNNE